MHGPISLISIRRNDWSLTLRILAVISALVAIAVSSPSAFADDASTGFDRLAQLSGAWRIEHPKTAKEKALRIRFEVIAAGSALVERFLRPNAQPTETVYHRDGKHLMATHYCAQGNQPRLRLSSRGDAELLVFDFLDATNLQSVANSHLTRLSFQWRDLQHLEHEEVYVAGSKPEPTTYSLVRVK
jgi:hypothetical protein